MNEPVPRVRALAWATPGPSGTGKRVPVEVAVEHAAVTLTDEVGARATVRPARIRSGRVGRLDLVVDQSGAQIRLDFEEGPKAPIASPPGWAGRHDAVAATGYRDLLAAFDAAGVEVEANAGARAAAGGLRTSIVVAAPVLVLVELVAFGVPSAVLGQILGGSSAIPAGVQSVVAGVLLVALLAAAVASARIPVILSTSRAAAGAASGRDPVAAHDALANRPSTWMMSWTAVWADRVTGSVAGDQPAFVPFRPLVPNLALVAALVAHTVSWAVREPPGESPTGPYGRVPEVIDATPDWLGRCRSPGSAMCSPQGWRWPG